jgi:hypothetical protein
MTGAKLYPEVSATTTRSVSDLYIDLLCPAWRDISLFDIAYSLSAIPRWTGHRWRQISVLEHSLRVYTLANEGFHLEALLHDAHEAYTGDISRPMQKAIEAKAQSIGAAGASSAIELIKFGIDVAIVRQVFFACGLPKEQQADEAPLLAHQMRSVGLEALDDMALREEAASADLPTSDDKPAEFRHRLIDRWIGSVQHECRRRYGV